MKNRRQRIKEGVWYMPWTDDIVIVTKWVGSIDGYSKLEYGTWFSLSSFDTIIKDHSIHLTMAKNDAVYLGEL